MKRFRVEWQGLTWSCSQHNQSPPGLGHTIVACLQYLKPHLISHLDQCSQDQFEHHSTLILNQVTDILKDKELWSVEITVGQVSGNQRVLELGVLSVLEVVKDGESLAWWSSYQEINISFL